VNHYWNPEETSRNNDRHGNEPSLGEHRGRLRPAEYLQRRSNAREDAKEIKNVLKVEVSAKLTCGNSHEGNPRSSDNLPFDTTSRPDPDDPGTVRGG
jgi:hypothetical protein